MRLSRSEFLLTLAGAAPGVQSACTSRVEEWPESKPRGPSAVVIRPRKPLDSEDTFTPEEEKVISKGFRELRQGESVAWEDLKHELAARS